MILTKYRETKFNEHMNYFKQEREKDLPNEPEKHIPLKPDLNPDPTKRIPEKNDPTRIEEPEKTDPTRIDEPDPNNPDPSKR